MSAAVITAVATGAAGIISAVTALVIALRGHARARAALKAAARAHMRLAAIGAPPAPPLPEQQAPKQQ